MFVAFGTDGSVLCYPCRIAFVGFGVRYRYSVERV